MTDPDTLAAAKAVPATIEEAVLDHLAEPLPPPPVTPAAPELDLPPTDPELFASVPRDLPKEIPATLVRSLAEDDDWEDDAPTGVYRAPRAIDVDEADIIDARPVDPTGCMM